MKITVYIDLSILTTARGKVMIPINVAITGHRDLKKDKFHLYKEQIILVLKDLKRKYPDSEIQILSGMAEGADIIGAQAALESGCKLVAVLPMPREDFIQTFTINNTAESAVTFEDTLSKADKIIDLSKMHISTNDIDDAYIRLGVYLIENSQMMIALWNGIYSGNPGGTSSVVKFALEGIPRKYRKKYSIIDNFNTIPVNYINVERIKKETGVLPSYIEVNTGEYCTMYPSIWEGSDIGKVTSYYHNQLKEIDFFNNQCCKDKNILNLLKGSEKKEVQSIKGITKIIKTQNAADCIAGSFQKKTKNFLITQLLFGFFVFFWVALVDEIFPFAPYILLLSPLFFLLCVITLRYINKKNIQERYYDYRALAECLRVQFYWKTVGIKENAYACYTKKSNYELSWIIAAARNISMDINYFQVSESSIKPDYNNIEENWMTDQFKYFSNKNKNNKAIIQRNKNKMYTFFGAGILFVILLIVERLYISTFYNSEYIMHILLFLIDASLAGGAVFSGYLDKRQFESELKQHSRIVNIFNQGIKEFKSVSSSGNRSDIEKIIIEMGTDALAENADWVVYNRMNNIDLPLG